MGRKTEQEIEVPNVLVHDFEKWTKWILERVRAKIGHLYPPGKDGRPVVGYLWARTAPCSNPTCRGEIPLLRSLLVCNKPDKKVALTMDVDKTPKTVWFGIVRGRDIRETKGTAMDRAALCPFCHQPTPAEDIKRSSFEGTFGERIVAVIVENKRGKDYRAIEEGDDQAFQKAKALLDPALVPSEAMPDSPDLVTGRGWNFKTWSSLFNPRQLVAMQTFVACLHEALEAMKKDIGDDEYRKAVGVYLGLWISRNSMRMTSMARWDTGGEKFQTPFDAQAIPMKWDYPEANPFSMVTGGFFNQAEWVMHYLNHESTACLPATVYRGDGAHLQTCSVIADLVVTDPPYFDAIAYGDLSDFFYIWLKRALGDGVSEALVTPLVPKSDEATALKHRHGGDPEKADVHFKAKLAAVLKESHRVLKPGGIISVMFAHQSTKAWTALIHAIFEAGLTVDATWPIDTELPTAQEKGY